MSKLDYLVSIFSKRDQSVVNSYPKSFIIFIVFLSTHCFGQYDFPTLDSEAKSSVNVSGKANYRKAKRLLFKDNYIVALPYLEKVIEKRKAAGKNTDKMVFQLGICYLVSKSPAKGLTIIDSIEKVNPKVHTDLPYWKAVAYHYNYLFDQAIEQYNRALRLPSVAGDERDDIRKKIKECENGKLLVNQPLDLEIINGGIMVNTIFSEHSPTIENDSRTVYFTSRKNIDGQNATFTGEYFEDIYVTKLDSNAWAKPQGHADFNTKEHDACSQISNNNNTMVMYRSTRNGDIYISNRENGKWAKPKVVKGLNSMSYESSGLLTKDGNRMYFTSNKFSDQGDLDIYYMDKTSEGAWGRPKSIGAHINTPYNEDGLFISEDGSTLYFSSQGHNSMGGFDIFKSEWEGSKWGKPVNMGHPINSPSDDIYYTISTNQKFAMYSSYREGGVGMRDIYLAVPTEKVLANITLIDSLTNVLVDSAVTVQLKSKNSTYELSQKLADGKFSQKINNREKLEINILKANKIIYTDTITVAQTAKTGLTFVKSFTVPYHTVTPDRTPKDTAIYEKLHVKEDADTAIISKDYIFGNIFFEKNHSKITKKYFPALYELIRIMKENKEIIIEIQGFADEDGDLDYNKSLSELRAHNVYDFLTSRGISRKRIVFKGYGQTDQFSAGTEREKKQNRRAQFVKVK